MKIDHAAACRFFSAEDVCCWALAAYYQASKDILPPLGEPWFAEGVAYSSSGYFTYSVHRRFTDALNAAAVAARIVCDHGTASEPCHWDDSDYRDAVLAASSLNRLPPSEKPGNNVVELESHRA